MMPFRQYSIRQFNPHVRRRRAQAKCRRIQKEEEMREATLRAGIPERDFEDPIGPPPELQYQRRHHRSRSQEEPRISPNDTLYRSPTPFVNKDSANELPVLLDGGSAWAQGLAQDNVYWNSTLVERPYSRYGKDGNPWYPYRAPREQKSSLQLIRQPPKPLTAAQRAKLEELRAREKRVLTAKEKEALSKAASAKQKSRKEPVRVANPDEPKQRSHKTKERAVEPNEPEHYFTRPGGHHQHQLHVEMANLPDDIPVVCNYGQEGANEVPWPPSAFSTYRVNSEAPLTPAFSRDFDPFAPLSVDESILIYRNKQGKRRIVLPHNPAQHREKAPLQSPNGPSEPSQIPIPETPKPGTEAPTHNESWDATSNNTLNHESIDPETVMPVRQRAIDSSKMNENDKTSNVNATNVGLEPNFSHPIVATQWNDQWYAERHFEEQDQEWLETAYQPPSASGSSSVRRFLQYLYNFRRQDVGPEGGAVNEPFTNGVPESQHSRGSSTSSRRDSDPTHVRPSGPATDDDTITYYPDKPPSPTVSPATLVRDQEKTLAMQEKLMRKLHRKVNKLQRERDHYKEELFPELAAALESAESRAELYNNASKDLEHENDELWKLSDLSKRILNLYWDRDEAVRDMVGHLIERKTQRGVVRRLFKLKKPKTEGQSDKVHMWRRSKRRSKPMTQPRTASVANSYGSSVGESSLSRLRARDRAPRRSGTFRSNLAVAFSSSKVDLEELLDVAELNLRVLGEDLEDWADMEQRCLELRDEQLRDV